MRVVALSWIEKNSVTELIQVVQSIPGEKAPTPHGSRSVLVYYPDVPGFFVSKEVSPIRHLLVAIRVGANSGPLARHSLSVSVDNNTDTVNVVRWNDQLFHKFLDTVYKLWPLDLMAATGED